ncbi:MAG: hypothetical protein ACREOZ_02890, partial [Gloeomargaritales cyanobacterium]
TRVFDRTDIDSDPRFETRAQRSRNTTSTNHSVPPTSSANQQKKEFNEDDAETPNPTLNTPDASTLVLESDSSSDTAPMEQQNDINNILEQPPAIEADEQGNTVRGE